MIVTLPLAGGCIRENMDDCKGKVTLRFRYVGDGTTDIFPEKIEHVTMYVYSIADGSLAYSIAGIGRFYNRLQVFERWMRRIVGWLFTGTGLYYLIRLL